MQDCPNEAFCNHDAGAAPWYCEYCEDITGSGISCADSGLFQTGEGVATCQTVCGGWLLQILKY